MSHGNDHHGATIAQNSGRDDEAPHRERDRVAVLDEPLAEHVVERERHGSGERGGDADHVEREALPHLRDHREADEREQQRARTRGRARARCSTKRNHSATMIGAVNSKSSATPTGSFWIATK